MAELWQTNMFGPAERIDNIAPEGRMRDDAPVPAERELLWPAPHVEILGPDLLERLYGDLPRRTRLTVPEVCRRLRCGHSHVYELKDAGSLDFTDYRHPQATQQALLIYRYSLVRFLFSREFCEGDNRVNLPRADLDRIERLVSLLKAERRRLAI